MRRSIAIGFGLLETVAPRRIVDPAERLAFENPDTGRLRPRTLPMARLEGAVFVWLLLRRPERVRTLRTPLGVLGVVLALVPRRALEFGLETAYENPDELEVKPWVVPATRLLGACYLVAGLFAGRAGDPAENEPPSTND